MLGQHALDTRGVYGDREWQRERERFYKCALSAAQECPDQVATLALTAAERVARSTCPENSAAAPRPRRRGLLGGTGVLRGPWPDGPLARVDEAFQNAVLDGAGIRDLYRVRPLVARQVVLATLIESPREVDWNHYLMREELYIVNRYKWLPGFYTHGPFLMCLRDNFTEGLGLVMRLVEFAAERADEYASRELRQRRARAVAEGQPEVEVDRYLASAVPRHITILDGDRAVAVSGDEAIYGWSAGRGNPPNAVESALMALEQYFYQRLDDGE